MNKKSDYKKQLLSLRKETYIALDEYKQKTGIDKSSYVDALLARELNVVIPDEVTSRHEAIEAEDTSETYKIVPTESSTTEPEPVSSDFEQPLLSTPEPEVTSPPQPAPLAPVNMITTPTPSDEAIVEPLETLSDDSTPRVTDTPVDDGPKDRICPTCGQPFNTSFCLNCLI